MSRFTNLVTPVSFSIICTSLYNIESFSTKAVTVSSKAIGLICDDIVDTLIEI